MQDGGESDASDEPPALVTSSDEEAVEAKKPVEKKKKKTLRQKRRSVKEGGTQKSERNEFTHFRMDPTCTVDLAATIQAAPRTRTECCDARCDAL